MSHITLHRFVSAAKPVVYLLASCIITVIISNLSNQVAGFHLSFGHRLIKSASSPQLNPASTLIRPIECRNTNNHTEVGICMFSIDCMQNKGVPLSVCKHNYFVGTCCRLPDYNNFVGIVYDLRDTEASQLLQARNELVTRASEPSSAPPPSSMSASSTYPYELSSIASPASSSSLPTSNSVQYSSTATTSGQESSTAAAASAPIVQVSREDLEARYIISSTSLFPQSAAAAYSTPQPSLPSSSMPADATTSVDQKMLPPNQSGESARNVDGVAPTIMVSSNNPQGQHRQQIVVPSELDSFHIQTAALATNQSVSAPRQQPPMHQQQPTIEVAGQSAIGHQAGAYELIKDNNNVVGDKLELTLSAAHQQAAHQQFNVIELAGHHNQDFKTDQRRPSITTTTITTTTTAAPAAATSQHLTFSERPLQSQADSIYLIDDPLQPNRNQANIVFANNHLAASTSSVGSTFKLATQQLASTEAISQMQSSSAAASTTSDQEFTLSSASSSTTNAVASAASDGGQDLYSSSSSISSNPSTLAAKTQSFNNATATPTITGGSPQQPQEDNRYAALHTTLPVAQTTFKASSQASTHVDLVSSNTVQTTTPFTSSLSTALLPNISSHPYAPTEEPPSSLVPPNQTFSSASSSFKLSSTSLGTTPSQSSWSSGGQSTLGQLYSNQHSSSGGSSSQSGDSHAGEHGNYLHPRPSGGLMGLQAATKIVSGGSSSANNLIPGLSGLQSAILSHIPFKIATGLSSGLSSYLAAAMKPNGNRPLLSSNTAPSLQYQQEQKQQQLAANGSTSKWPQQVASSTMPTVATPNSGIRFPGASPTSSSSAAPETGSTNSFAQHPLAAAAANDTNQSAVRGNHDVVRAAQLMCGRPQVPPPQQLGLEGKKRVARIVGGNQSLFGQWPWMVSLRQWRKGAFLHKCGAALLNENWAITAAHCVENVKASDLLLRLGEFDVSNQEEPYPFVERRVKTVVSHPSFDPKTFEYDLALLRFAEPIKYERNIVPVCIPSGNDSYVDRMATVIGWGRLYEDGPLPDVIQHVDVPIITNNECEKMYKNAGYIEEIPEMFICAGISKGGRDSCEGDSGGPLTMVDHDGRSYLVGIISWGIGCALPSQPGVYTRITAFSGWINQITAF